MKKRTQWRLTKLLLGYIGAQVALSTKLSKNFYRLTDQKITQDARFLLLTDLHSQEFAEDQQELIQEIETLKPDFVLLGGDIFDHRGNIQATITLLDYLGSNYRTYFVTGNHEFAFKSVDAIKKLVKNFNIKVLDGVQCQLTKGDMTFTLSGVDDASRKRDFKRQLRRVGRSLNTKHYNILLTHQPQKIKEYSQYPFDLILAGHAHGGQIRIPWLNFALYAPQQGFNPTYTDGLHILPNQSILGISRGLAYATTRIPRVLNRPNIVVVDLAK